jgi:hypothetical protein
MIGHRIATALAVSRWWKWTTAHGHAVADLAAAAACRQA